MVKKKTKPLGCDDRDTIRQARMRPSLESARHMLGELKEPSKKYVKLVTFQRELAIGNHAESASRKLRDYIKRKEKGEGVSLTLNPLEVSELRFLYERSQTPTTTQKSIMTSLRRAGRKTAWDMEKCPQAHHKMTTEEVQRGYSVVKSSKEENMSLLHPKIPPVMKPAPKKKKKRGIVSFF